MWPIGGEGLEPRNPQHPPPSPLGKHRSVLTAIDHSELPRAQYLVREDLVDGSDVLQGGDGEGQGCKWRWGSRRPGRRENWGEMKWGRHPWGPGVWAGVSPHSLGSDCSTRRCSEKLVLGREEGRGGGEGTPGSGLHSSLTPKVASGARTPRSESRHPRRNVRLLPCLLRTSASSSGEWAREAGKCHVPSGWRER